MVGTTLACQPSPQCVAEESPLRLFRNFVSGLAYRGESQPFKSSYLKSVFGTCVQVSLRHCGYSLAVAGCCCACTWPVLLKIGAPWSFAVSSENAFIREPRDGLQYRTLC